MAGTATHIYLSHEATEALAQRASSNRSAAVSRMIERYDELCRRALPELSEAEWNLVYDACNGWLVDMARSVAYLPHEVEDHIKLNGADAKWGVDGEVLMAKLAALDYAGCVAVVDAAERFWTK